MLTRFARISFAVATGSLAGGCFDDPESGDSDGDTTSAVGTDATGPTGADAADTNATTDATDTGAVDSTGEGPTVTLSGQVVKFFTDPGTGSVEGVQVSLVGNPEVSAVTDAEGNFILQGVPAGQVAYLASAPSASQHGGVVGVDVMFADMAGIELSRFSRLGSSMIEDNLGVSIDAGLGAIATHGSNALMTVTLDPVAAMGTYYSLDAMGNPVLDDPTTEYLLAPMVVFFNVEPVDPGDVEISATHPAMTCLPDFPAPPVLPDHITYAAITCG